MKRKQNMDNVVQGNWSGISGLERNVRIDLAACHRLADLNGFSDIVWNHISARVPGHQDRFLINLFGLRFDEVTASNLVTLDGNGAVVTPPQIPDAEEFDYESINVTGFVIHSAIYNAREDVHCVMHSHSAAGLAVSALEDGLVPLVQDAFQFYDRVAYHEYEGVSLDLDERERLAASLGDKPVMIMRNHGLMTTGATVAEAYVRMYYLEIACQVQLSTFSTGQKIRLPAPEVCERVARQYEEMPPAGTHEWPALLRELDYIDPSYRD